MISLAACLALFVAAGDGGSIRIGSFGPLTGGSAAKGSALAKGSRLAVEEINAAGGVLGRKIALVDGDDEAKPEKGAQLVKDFIEKDQVVAIVGAANTAVADAAAPVANQRQVPFIVTGATGSRVNELFAQSPQNYVFRMGASDALQSQMMVTEALATRGKTQIALLHDQTPYGTQGRARIEELTQQYGLKPAYVGMFKVGDADMTAQVTAARSAGAEVLLLQAQGAEAAAIARSLQKIGWKAPIIGTWNLASPDFLTSAGPFGEGAVMPQTIIEAGANEPKQLEFIAAYRKRYGVPRVDMAPAAAQAYDAVRLLALAIRQAGSTEGAKVKAALEALKGTYQGATGSYDSPWRPNDHEAITPASVVWGLVKGGRIVPDDPSARGR